MPQKFLSNPATTSKNAPAGPADFGQLVRRFLGLPAGADDAKVTARLKALIEVTAAIEARDINLDPQERQDRTTAVQLDRFRAALAELGLDEVSLADNRNVELSPADRRLMKILRIPAAAEKGPVPPLYLETLRAKIRDGRLTLDGANQALQAVYDVSADEAAALLKEPAGASPDLTTLSATLGALVPIGESERHVMRTLGISEDRWPRG